MEEMGQSRGCSRDEGPVDSTWARFHNKAGYLTVYALACGYVEEFGDHVRLSLDSPGSGCFHVRRHPAHPAGWKWETAQNVIEARKLARRLAAEVPSPAQGQGAV